MLAPIMRAALLLLLIYFIQVVQGRGGQAPAPVCQSTLCTLTFNYTGSVQTWTPIGTFVVSIEAYGAQGGSAPSTSNVGGKGGRIVISNISTSSLLLKTTTTNSLFVYVGGAGTYNIQSSAGGYNGGGQRNDNNFWTSGGGGTDIRTNASAAALTSRLVVAGGGGGGTSVANGGAGGGGTGAAGIDYFASNGQVGGGGGSQVAGGLGHKDISSTSTAGGLGYGGSGADHSGGGGGGYFGGGGGVGSSGGGGGSSFAASGYTITNNTRGVASPLGDGNGALFITYTACPAGSYLYGSTCRSCMQGTYGPSPGQTHCLVCAAGTYNPSTGSKSASACLACAANTFSASGASMCYTPTLKFTYTGGVQSFAPVVGAVSSFIVDAFGAEGGSYNDGLRGGFGGYISVSNITLSSLSLSNHTLFIYVGGVGGINVIGGFNGGGYSDGPQTFTSGGGATDLRTSIASAASSLPSRIVVAGGGGGAGAAALGGDGGGVKGHPGSDDLANGAIGGGGGSQTTGGARAGSCAYTSAPGTLGVGGNSAQFGGGGGGGFYGGGGGACSSGGGGGSSYADSTYTITANSQGVQSRNGVLYITLICHAGYSNCACAAGYYYSASTQSCITCAAGTYNPSWGKTSCQSCEIGMYNPSTGSTSSSACLACENGKYSSSAGSSSCDSCEAGFYLSNNSCVVCNAGSVTNTLNFIGATSCTPCSSGKYSSSSRVACVAASLGFYANATSGATGQTPCPPNTFSRGNVSSCASCGYTYTQFSASNMIGFSFCPPIPTGQPTKQPSTQPSSQPTRQPTSQPRAEPSMQPSHQPTSQPSTQPTHRPSTQPSMQPSGSPSTMPTSRPTAYPSLAYVFVPSRDPHERMHALGFTNMALHGKKSVSTSYIFKGLGASEDSSHHQWFLRANLANTGFPKGASVSFTIGSASGKTLAVPACSPSLNCTSNFTTCFGESVLSVISPNYGGSLQVSVSTTGDWSRGASSSDVSCHLPYLNASNAKFDVYVALQLQSVMAFPTPAPIKGGRGGGGGGGIVIVQAPASALQTIIQGNNPIIGLATVIAAFAIFSLVLLNLRKSKANVVQVPPISFCWGVVSTGITLATEGILMAVLLSSSSATFTALGAIVLLSRLGHLFPSLYLMFYTFGPEEYSAYYAELIDESQMLQHSLPYGLLGLLALLETSCFRYLPWKQSEFAFEAGGYPDMHVVRVCVYFKNAQALLTAVVQFTFVLSINAGAVNVSASSKVFFILGLLVTLGTLVLGCFEALMRSRMLLQVAARMEKAADILARRASRRASAMSALRGGGGGGGGGRGSDGAIDLESMSIEQAKARLLVLQQEARFLSEKIDAMESARAAVSVAGSEGGGGAAAAAARESGRGGGGGEGGGEVVVVTYTPFSSSIKGSSNDSSTNHSSELATAMTTNPMLMPGTGLGILENEGQRQAKQSRFWNLQTKKRLDNIPTSPKEKREAHEMQVEMPVARAADTATATSTAAIATT